MGRDKALLPFRGGVLGESVARAVECAAGSAVLVGNPELGGRFGYPAIADLHPGEGPLGGILTALAHTAADWNLVVACDMPGVTGEFLRGLIEAAERLGAGALVPAGPSGIPEPLCAVYHGSSRAALETAFRCGVRQMTEGIGRLRTVIYPVPQLALFQNVNTPEEWAAHAPK